MGQFQVFGTSGSYGGFLRLVTGLPFWLGILIPPLLPIRSVFGFLIRPPVFEERGVKVNFFGSKKKKKKIGPKFFFHKTKVIENQKIRKLTAYDIFVPPPVWGVGGFKNFGRVFS